MSAAESAGSTARVLSVGASAGMTWMVVGNVLTRLLGLLGQILLGWLLLPADFGAYALAISIVTAVAALRSGGITQVAIQKGSEFSDYSLYLRYAFGFNMLAMAILLCLALPYIASASATGMVLAGIALSIPAGTHASIARIKLTIDGRFRELSAITFWSALVWQATVAAFALSGFGAYSFVLPSLLQALYESVAAWRIAGITGRNLRSDGEANYWNLFLQCRWIMLSAAMLALATTGDYFAVSMLTDAATVGTYFFAFQLIAAIGGPINSSIESVLPAFLASLGTDHRKQADSYLRIVRLLIVVSLPMGIVAALSVPIAIQLLWRDRWDGAVLAVQIMAMCIPAWLLTAVGRSLVEARAMWRGRFAMMALYGVGGMTSAAIGALLGDVAMIALCVAVFYACFALGLQCWLSVAGIAIRDTAMVLTLPLVLNTAAALVSIELVVLLAGSAMPVPRYCIAVLAFIVLSGVTNLVFFRKEWHQLYGLTMGRIAAMKSRRLAFDN